MTGGFDPFPNSKEQCEIIRFSIHIPFGFEPSVTFFLAKSVSVSILRKYLERGLDIFFTTDKINHFQARCIQNTDLFEV